MSVVIRIKGKIDFNDLTNEEVDYGVRDTAYRLCKAEDNSKLVVFFNISSIGRGIEVDNLGKKKKI